MYFCGQWTESSLINGVAWCLFGTKPWPNAILSRSTKWIFFAMVDETTCITNTQKYVISIRKLLNNRFNTLRPIQHGCHLADDIFKLIYVYEYWCIIPMVPTNNNQTLTHWCRETHIYLSVLGHHRFILWPVAYSAPSHYLNNADF